MKEGEGVKEGGCEVVRSLHVPGRCLFLPVSLKGRVR